MGGGGTTQALLSGLGTAGATQGVQVHLPGLPDGATDPGAHGAHTPLISSLPAAQSAVAGRVREKGEAAGAGVGRAGGWRAVGS